MSAATMRLVLSAAPDHDAALPVGALERAGYTVRLTRVATADELRAALRAGDVDLVISDDTSTGFDALAALEVFGASRLEVPFIVVSPPVGEERVVALLKAGADDFVLAANLARLGPAFEQARREVAMRAEQRRLQEQLMTSERMASIGTLAAGVAHEINNPLAAVLGNLNFIQEGLQSRAPADPETTTMLEAASDACAAAERVRQIVKDVRVFSRAGEDRAVPVDVNRVLDSTLRMAWNDIRHRARVVKRYGRLRAVLSTEARLGQVFLNLIVNAAQAVDVGDAPGNEIRLTTEMDGAFVVVTVEDTGCGMSPDVLARVFTPFFTTKPPNLGTGIGLSICRRIVTNLGGDIEVASQAGEGSTFRVRLPSTDAEPSTHMSATDLLAFRERRGRVLVLDDEVMVTSVVRRVLGPSHDVSVAFRAAEALDRISRGERFDLILSDLLMPEMTGMAFHEALSRVAPDQADRVVFMSGGAFTTETMRFLERFPGRQLEKPFDRATLLAVVSTSIR